MDLDPFIELLTGLMSDNNDIRYKAEQLLENIKSNVPNDLVLLLLQTLKTVNLNSEVEFIYVFFNS